MKNATNIAIMNSGGIKSKILEDTLSMEDLLKILPYKNTIDVLELKGSTIRKILEKSATLLSSVKEDFENFLQVSGRITFKMACSLICGNFWNNYFLIYV